MRKLLRFISKILRRYNITIRSDEDFEEKITFSINYLIVTAIIVSIFVLGLISSFFIWRYIYDNYYLTEYAMQKNKLEQDLRLMAKHIDELEQAHQIKDEYIQTYKILLGKYDSLPAEVVYDSAKYEIKDRFELPKTPVAKPKILASISFISPIVGYKESKRYEPKSYQFGVEIATKTKESVLAVADGKVLFAGWTADNAYVLVIQHSDNFTSIYKNVSIVLTKERTKVLAGEAIAMLEQSQNATLKFELWYEGQAVDPSDYIIFQ